MAEAWSQGGKTDWKCEDCSRWNEGNVYRCAKCEKSKPYLSEVGPGDFSSSQDLDSCSSDHSSYDGDRQPLFPVSDNTRYGENPRFTPCGSMTRRSTGHGGPRAIGSGVSRKQPKEDVLEFPVKQCRVVLLGKTGSGKSSTGNTIVDFNYYPVGSSFKSTTAECSCQKVERFGVTLEVVDTPGFSDTELHDDLVLKEIMRCMARVSPGPHALLMVIRLDVRFTQEEALTVKNMRSTFGDKIMDHLIVVFTHGDELYGENVRDRLKDIPTELMQLLKDTEQRYVVFNNKETNIEKNQEQVKKLLLTIRGLLASSDNEPFCNPLQLRCQEIITHSERFTEILDGTITSDSVRTLVDGVFASKLNAEERLHELLDGQEKDSTEMLALRKKLKTLEDEGSEKITRLNLELQIIKKEKADLEKLLAQEKKKWKPCVII